MTTWILLASAAYASSLGLLGEPNYPKYDRAVTNLAAPSILPTEPQLAPATCGLVEKPTANPAVWIAVGMRCGIHAAPLSGFDYQEDHVLFDPATVDSLPTLQSYRFRYDHTFGDSAQSLTSELGKIRDQDQLANVVEVYQLGILDIDDKDVPLDANLNTPDLQFTPADPSDLQLFCFDVKQGLSNTAYLVTERRYLGPADGVLWVEHWLYRGTFNRIDKLGETATLVKHAANCTTIADFVGTVKASVGVGGLTGLTHYQPAYFPYEPLSDVAP